jgi:hypothetical protein
VPNALDALYPPSPLRDRLHGREAPANAAILARIAAGRIPPRSLTDDDLQATVTGWSTTAPNR